MIQDGSVRFWDASTASVFLLSKFSTSTFFSSDDIDDARGEEQAEEEEEEEWPPFRKVLICFEFFVLFSFSKGIFLFPSLFPHLGRGFRSLL